MDDPNAIPEGNLNIRVDLTANGRDVSMAMQDKKRGVLHTDLETGKAVMPPNFKWPHLVTFHPATAREVAAALVKMADAAEENRNAGDVPETAA